jgi:hypothetical protein
MRDYQTPEDLPSELQKYCEKWSTGVRFMHPFRFTCFPFSSDADILTEIAEQKASFQNAISRKEWSSAFELVEGWRHRFRYLNSFIEPEMPKDLCGDRAYWSLVFVAIRNSTNHVGQEEQVLKALDCSRSEKNAVLNGEDHETFIALRAPIIGWRGVNAPTKLKAEEYIKGGFSWSVDRDNAEWFSKRCIEQDGNAYVASAEFETHEIDAYFPSAGEGEFVVRPSSDRDIYFDTVIL